MRKRIFFLLQSLFLCAFFLYGAYVLSLFQSYSMQTFREKTTSQINFAAKLLEERLPANAAQAALEAETKRISGEMGLRLEIVRVTDEHESEVVRAYLDGMGSSVRTNPSTLERSLYLAKATSWEGYVLRAPFSLNEITDAYNNLRNWIIIGFLLAIVLTAFVARKMTRRLNRPLESMAKIAAEMSKENHGIRLDRKIGGEFGIISEALNTLADDRLKAETELKQQQKKLKVLMDNTDNSVMTLNGSGIVVDSNQQFRTLFGDHVQGSHHLQIVNNVALENMLQDCLKVGKALSATIQADTLAGKKSFQIYGAPLNKLDTDIPNSVLFVFHDITALQAIYEKQADFVSNASHELSTPLTTIKGFAEVLLAEQDAGENEQEKKFLRIILQESGRMQALLKDLLQLARLDSSEYRKSIVVKAFAPSAIIAKIEEELCVRAEAKNLSLVIAQDGNLPLVWANEDWFKQILLNLLENAFKYTPEGGTIKVSALVKGDFVEFTVFNTGEGITAREAQRIFERFYRIDKARTRQIGGTGLGLSIVKFFVEIFGGTIRVESNPGEGVAFIFSVPIAQEETIPSS